MVAHPSGLTTRRLYIHRMTDGGAECMAAAFRSVGIDAVVVPPSDARTFVLGAQHLAGDECLPAKLTLGDYLKVVEAPGFDPEKSAFLMPTTEGPCRFGQYAPYIRKVFRDLGYPGVPVFSPTSGDAYEEIGSIGPELRRTAWRGFVASDVLRKILYRTRPYERTPGDADAAHADAVRAVCAVLGAKGVTHRERLARLRETLTRIRGRFRAIPACYERGRLLIGIQGEIFCRLNEFSNDDLIRRVEASGGEAWLSDISEWVWYCNNDQEFWLRKIGKRFSLTMLGAKVRDRIQRADEVALREVFGEDFIGYEEPADIDIILRAGDRYLPQAGAMGEMVLSAGKVDFFFRKGADGIIDISPFSCMNGIVSEALYPRQTQEHAGIPIKNFYFDGKEGHRTQDLEMFLEMARAYQVRKPHPRRYPACFDSAC